MKSILAVFILLCAFHPAQGKIQTKIIEYKSEETTLEGYLAFDDAKKGKRPAVLVVHEWMGVDGYVKKRAEQLAKLGYIAFAPDIYGKGVRPGTPDEAGKTAGIYKKDRTLTRARAQAGLNELLKQPQVDAKRVAAMGYCFGGMVALELGRSGAPIQAIVSVHGSLDTPKPEDANQIKGHVLVLHGGDDPYVSKEDVLAFEDEMRKAKVDWQLIVYGGAVHRFSNPEAGSNPSTGLAYNAAADQRSWLAMENFYREVLK